MNITSKYNDYIYNLKYHLDQWLLRNRQSSNEEIEREATKYSLTKKR